MSFPWQETGPTNAMTRSTLTGIRSRSGRVKGSNGIPWIRSGLQCANIVPGIRSTGLKDSHSTYSPSVALSNSTALGIVACCPSKNVVSVLASTQTVAESEIFRLSWVASPLLFHSRRSCVTT